MLARLAMRPRAPFIILITAVALLTGVSPACAQSHERDTLIGVNSVGPLFGGYSATVQQLLRNDLSIFVRGVYYDPEWSVVCREWSVLCRGVVPEDWKYWSVDVEIGANYYPQDSAPGGLFVGLGVAPSYFHLRDKVDKEAPGFRMGVVTQIGYQFVWGPIAVAPGASMGHQWVFAEPAGLYDDPNLENENGIKGVVSGFWLGVGLDLAIAF